MLAHIMLLTALTGAAAPADIPAEHAETSPVAVGEQSVVSLATYRGGQVTQAELDAWKFFRRQRGGQPERLDDAHHLRRIILTEALDAEFSTRLDELQPVYESWRRIPELESAEQRLRQLLVAAIDIRDEQIRKRFEQIPEDERVAPPRWILQNIFKRFPDGAEEDSRRQIRLELEHVRQAIVEGASFREMARRESESQTRARGGRLGSVTLDRLAPPIAEVVATMKAGDLSPVIETEDGVTLLRCTSVVAERRQTLDSERQEIEQTLRQEALQHVQRKLEERLYEELAPVYSLKDDLVKGVDKSADTAGSSSSAQDTVATFAIAGERRGVSRQDLEFYLRHKGLDRPLTEIPEETLERWLRRRVLLEAIEHEADRRGLLDDAYWTKLEWELRLLRAELVRDAAVRQQMQPISTQAIRQAYEQKREQLQHPEARKMRALVARIDRSLPKQRYRHARAVGERLEAGEICLDAAHETLGSLFAIEELGWLTDKQIWRLGENIETRLRGLEAGAATGLIQEGPKLYMIEIVDHRPARPQTLEEASPSLERLLTQRQGQQRRAKFDEEKIASLAVEVLK